MKIAEREILYTGLTIEPILMKNKGKEDEEQKTRVCVVCNMWGVYSGFDLELTLSHIVHLRVGQPYFHALTFQISRESSLTQLHLLLHSFFPTRKAHFGSAKSDRMAALFHREELWVQVGFCICNLW